MEYYWKSPFQNSNDAYRFLLTSTNYMLALTFLIVVIVMLSRNFRDILEKLQEYKIHFYEDLVLARILQERIFEYDHSLTKGYDLELVYLPYAELSGDLYDFSVPEDTYLRIFLADARGHGINSSLSSMLIKKRMDEPEPDYHVSPGNVISTEQKSRSAIWRFHIVLGHRCGYTG